MKKFAIALLAFCLTLAGCGKQQTRAGFTTLMRQDVPIALNAPAAPVLAALGAPFGYGESKSGLYSGVEKTYQFTGLRLKTFQSQDGERILGVMITSAGMQTPEGISVGDDAARVRECLGEETIENDCCIVTRSREKMVVLLEHDVVTAIQYTML